MKLSDVTQAQTGTDNPFSVEQIQSLDHLKHLYAVARSRIERLRKYNTSLSSTMFDREHPKHVHMNPFLLNKTFDFRAHSPKTLNAAKSTWKEMESAILGFTKLDVSEFDVHQLNAAKRIISNVIEFVDSGACTMSTHSYQTTCTWPVDDIPIDDSVRIANGHAYFNDIKYDEIGASPNLTYYVHPSARKDLAIKEITYVVKQLIHPLVNKLDEIEEKLYQLKHSRDTHSEDEYEDTLD